MPSHGMKLGFVLLAASALAGCNSTATAPVASPAAALAAPLAALPGGSGCGASIARTRAVVDSDVATGNLNTPVGNRFRADLDRASAACAAGHEGEALRELAAAKARYGYPG
jgi:hypothetical protein